MRSVKGMLRYTFEYEGVGEDDLGYFECRVHYDFTPGTPETGRGYMADPARYDPGSGHEVDYEYAERDVGIGGQTIWQRLMPGEWLDGHCRAWLAEREECDLIEGTPDRGED